MPSPSRRGMRPTRSAWRPGCRRTRSYAQLVTDLLSCSARTLMRQMLLSKAAIWRQISVAADHGRYWPEAPVRCAAAIQPLSGVVRTCSRWCRLDANDPEQTFGTGIPWLFSPDVFLSPDVSNNEHGSRDLGAAHIA